MSTEAQSLFPIDEDAGKNKRQRVEDQRRQYVEDHWQDVYDSLVFKMKRFDFTAINH